MPVIQLPFGQHPYLREAFSTPVPTDKYMKGDYLLYRSLGPSCRLCWDIGKTCRGVTELPGAGIEGRREERTEGEEEGRGPGKRTEER